MSNEKTPQIQRHPLTPLDEANLDKWLDDAIKNHSDVLKFGEFSHKDFPLKKDGLDSFSDANKKNISPATKQENKKDLSPKNDDPNSTVNLSRFGIKSPNDLKVFLLSPAGGTVKAEIGAHIAQEQAMKEQQLFEARERAERHHRIKAALFALLLSKKGHSAEQQRGLIDTLNEQAIQRSTHTETPKKSPSSSAAAKTNSGLQAALAHYDAAIRNHQEQHNKLSEERQSLKDNLKKQEQEQTVANDKFKAYDKSLKALDQSIEKDEQLSPEQLDKKISVLESKLNTQTDQISSLLEKGEDKKAVALLTKQNALNLQLAGLQDIRAKQKGEKSFYNAKGEEVSSLRKADFVVPSSQKITVKDGKHYLIDRKNTEGKENKLEDLSSVEQIKAQQKFERSQHQLMSLSKSVDHTKKAETEFRKNNVSDTKNKLTENKIEKLKVENQINLMQSARANAHKTMEQPQNSRAATPSPMPTSSSNKVSVVSSNSQTMTASVKGFLETNKKAMEILMGKKGGKKGPSEQQLFDFVDKTKSSDAEKKDVTAFIKKALNIGGRIPSMAPLPYQTMQSLLKYMEGFGANAYKFAGPARPPEPKGLKASLNDKVADMTPPQNPPQTEKTNGNLFHPTPFSTSRG